MLPWPVVSYQPGRVADDELDPEVREDELELAQALLVCNDGLVEDERLRVEPTPCARLADPLSVDRQVDRHLQRRKHLLPDHLAPALPRTEAVAVEDRAAVDDETAARERDKILDPAVCADRGHRRLDVVHANAVVLEHLVVLVELRLQAAEVGVPGRARVVVLPLLRVLRPRFVLGRARHEHLTERADSLGAPAAAPDLLDLVVEVGLVEHVVPQRLPRLEPGQRLEDSLLVMGRRCTRRRVSSSTVSPSAVRTRNGTDSRMFVLIAMPAMLRPTSRVSRET